MRMIILREGAHLGRRFGRIEPDHLIHHQCIGKAVRNMMESTKLVCHRVHNAEESVGKCHTGHCRSICNFFACFHILTVFIGTGQIGKEILKRTERNPVGIVRRHNGSICFQCV